MIRHRLIAVLGVLAAMVAAPAAAQASGGDGISISVNPAPPQAVLTGGQLGYTYNVNYNDTPETLVLQVLDSSQRPVAGTTQSTSMAGQTSGTYAPVGEQEFNVPGGLAPGVYYLQASYYSQQICEAFNPSDASCADAVAQNDPSLYAAANATTEFVVAPSTGQIHVITFEDMNGTGTYANGDPLLPNWNFNISVTAPWFTSGAQAVTPQPVTNGAGAYDMNSAAAGSGVNYSVNMLFSNSQAAQWAPTTATSSAFNLPAGGDETLYYGVTQPTSVCGNVYNDPNGNGTDETAFTAKPVTITMTGSTGAGASVSSSTATDSTGHYCFTGVLPGSYSLTETVPSGYEATGRVDASGNGLISPVAVVSGQPSDNNDFGLNTPPVAPVPVLPTTVCGAVKLDPHYNGSDEAAYTASKVTISLVGKTATGLAVSNTTQTGTGGAYCFTSVAPGSYTLTDATPKGYEETRTASAVSDGHGVISPVTVVSGTPSSGHDFTIAKPPVAPVAKLCFRKTVSRARAYQGQSVTYTLKVTNCSKVTAKRVAIIDPLMAGVSLDSLGKGSLADGDLVWSVGTLKAGRSRTYRFTITFATNSAVGKRINRAEAEASNAKTVHAHAVTRVLVKRRPPVVVHVTG